VHKLAIVATTNVSVVWYYCLYVKLYIGLYIFFIHRASASEGHSLLDVLSKFAVSICALLCTTCCW